jgi:hypothetical protein
MNLRALPSVDRLLNSDLAEGLISQYGRPLSVEAIRESLLQARAEVQSGGDVPTEKEML